MNPDIVKRFQKLIEGPLNGALTSVYPNYMASYMAYRKKNGPQCPMCKSAARYMFTSEVSRKGQDFITRFNTNDWNNYN